MTLVRRGLGVAVDFVGAAAWGLLAFVIAANVFSATAGGLIAVAVFLSASAMMLSANLQESWLTSLTAGVCPRCRGRAELEHRHRRWDADRSQWLAPLMSWECAACSYTHNESWPCPTCPTPG